jgi:hypothetical protein
MFGTDFDEKCIMMHFWGWKKVGNALGAEARRANREKLPERFLSETNLIGSFRNDGVGRRRSNFS